LNQIFGEKMMFLSSSMMFLSSSTMFFSSSMYLLMLIDEHQDVNFNIPRFIDEDIIFIDEDKNIVDEDKRMTF